MIKVLSSAVFAIVLLGIACPAAPAQADSPGAEVQTIKDAIQALDQQLNDAAVKGDLKVVGKMMADNYVGVAPDGTILRKPAIAAHYQAGTLHYESVVNSDVEIHVHGDCAVLTAISTVKGHDGETDLSGTYRIMRIFLRRDGQWKIVAFQATRMRTPIGS